MSFDGVVVEGEDVGQDENGGVCVHEMCEIAYRMTVAQAADRLSC